MRRSPHCVTFWVLRRVQIDPITVCVRGLVCRNQRTAVDAETGRQHVVVDGHFKTQFAEEGAAQKAATELLANYPMLQVAIYDALTKVRTLMKAAE